MIFPIGDDNIQGGHKPYLSYTFLVINVVIYVFQITRLGDLEGIDQFLVEFGAIPAEITVGEDLFTLFTSMFLHAGPIHLAGNMLFLWIFADNIEAILGSAFFGLYYVLGGLFAVIIHILTDPISPIHLVGASGAISAVLGTYLVMFPKSRIKMIFIIFIRRPFYISALIFIGLWFGQQILSAFGLFGDGEGVAWWAHIGGFVYGVLLGFLFKKIYKNRYSYTVQA